MAQESAPQREAGRKRDFQWGVLLGLLLAALNAQVLYLEFYSRDLGLFGRQSKTLLIFQYLLLCFLLFLFVGLLSGDITGQVRPVRRISMTAGLIGFISGIVVTFVLSALGGLEGLYLLLTGEGILVDLLLPVLCVGGGISGGLIGSRILRPVALHGRRWVFRLVLIGLVIVELVSTALGDWALAARDRSLFWAPLSKNFRCLPPKQPIRDYRRNRW